MTYSPSDDNWLESVLSGSSVANLNLYSEPTEAPYSTFVVNRTPSKPLYYYGTSSASQTAPKYKTYEKKQNQSAQAVLPAVLPASSDFIDASSPDAWKPRILLSSSPALSPVSIPSGVMSPGGTGDLYFNEEQTITSGGSMAGDGSKRDSSMDAESKQNLYKTEMCRNWVETGVCRYGTRCQFAHGEHEMRDVVRHRKYKTEICRTFHTTGTCAYGKRCRFVHHEGEMRVVSPESMDPTQVFSHQLGMLHASISASSKTVESSATTPEVPSSPRYASPSSPARSPDTSRSVPATPTKEVGSGLDGRPALFEEVSGDGEETEELDTPLKKTAYRLPFFAKLHGWKKK